MRVIQTTTGAWSLEGILWLRRLEITRFNWAGELHYHLLDDSGAVRWRSPLMQAVVLDMSERAWRFRGLTVVLSEDVANERAVSTKGSTIVIVAEVDVP